MSALKQAALQTLKTDVSTEADRYVVAHNVTPFYRPFVNLAYAGQQEAQLRLVKLDFLPDKFLPVMAKAYGGDAEAQYELGRMYVQQIDAAKNPGSWELGLTWFRTAAEKGHEGARIIYNSLVQGN